MENIHSIFQITCNFQQATVELQTSPASTSPTTLSSPKPNIIPQTQSINYSELDLIRMEVYLNPICIIRDHEPTWLILFVALLPSTTTQSALTEHTHKSVMLLTLYSPLHMFYIHKDLVPALLTTQPHVAPRTINQMINTLATYHPAKLSWQRCKNLPMNWQ
jgi:hypothetical protein